MRTQGLVLKLLRIYRQKQQNAKLHVDSKQLYKSNIRALVSTADHIGSVWGGNPRHAEHRKQRRHSPSSPVLMERSQDASQLLIWSFLTLFTQFSHLVTRDIDLSRVEEHAPFYTTPMSVVCTVEGTSLSSNPKF